MEMLRRAALVACVAVVAGAGTGCSGRQVSADAQPVVDETSMSAAAVTAVDHHWGNAEADGDSVYVAGLLLPEYRSVGPTGIATTRAALLAHTAANADPRKREMARAAAADYRRAHPSQSSVIIVGNTAVLTFYVPTMGLEKGVRSSDVFVYRSGRWQALYSQHSTL